MKLTLVVIAIALCAASAVRADTLRQQDGTYTWDPRQWYWDKTKMDLPPRPEDGYASLVKQLSYPPHLQRRRIQGRGVSIISIDATGRVASITFSPRMAPPLEEIVVRAVRRTRFLPARRAGKPIAARALFPVTFVSRY